MYLAKIRENSKYRVSGVKDRTKKVDKRYKKTPNGEMVHNVVFEEHFGPIEDGWHVHHMDTNPTNNNPQNLIALPPKCHQWLHLNQMKLGRKYDRNGARDYLAIWLKRHSEMLVAQSGDDPAKYAKAVGKYKNLLVGKKTGKKFNRVGNHHAKSLKNRNTSAIHAWETRPNPSRW